MRLPKLLKREHPPEETPCPRCGVPAPAAAVECTACGWDLRERYADEGSAPTAA